MSISPVVAVASGSQDSLPVAQPPTSPKASSTRAVADTVRISAAAQTALQESTETPAQTAHEAQHGDHQAQRLLAREAAEKSRT